MTYALAAASLASPDAETLARASIALLAVIDGATSKVLSAQYQSATLYSDGSRWWVVS